MTKKDVGFWLFMVCMLLWVFFNIGRFYEFHSNNAPEIKTDSTFFRSEKPTNSETLRMVTYYKIHKIDNDNIMLLSVSCGDYGLKINYRKPLLSKSLKGKSYQVKNDTLN